MEKVEAIGLRPRVRTGLPATADRTEDVLAEVEQRIGSFFDAALVRAAQHPPRYRELWQELRASAAGGKRLRPRLVVSASLHLGDAPREPVVDLATAVELLHTAFLLHDDIIDGDIRRRGALNPVGAFAAAARKAGLAEPASQRWGQSAAILGGDLLLSAALRLTAGLDLDAARRDRLVELVDESIFHAAAGELADVAYASGLETPTPEDIRSMMIDKTAHYSLELPLRAGAILAGAPDELGDRLDEIGRSLGIVFQMQDDLLGVFGLPAETGKSTLTDLREGKQTMLIAFARGTAEWGAVDEFFGHDALDEPSAQRLRNALEASGARQRFEDEIRRERDRALRLIREADLPFALTNLLKAEAGLAAERRS